MNYGDTRDKLAQLEAQIAAQRAQVGAYQAEAQEIDQALVGATLTSKPLDLVVARERRAQLQSEIRRLNSAIGALDREREGVAHRFATLDGKAAKGRALLASLAATGLTDRALRRVEIGDLLHQVAQARAAMASAGEPVPDAIVLKV